MQYSNLLGFNAWSLIYFFDISADCLAARSLPARGLLLEAEWSSVGGDGGFP